MRHGAPPPDGDFGLPAFSSYQESFANLAVAEKQLSEALQRELPLVRTALYEAARLWVRPYLVFASAGVIAQLASLDGPRPERKKRDRSDERHLLLYLQRISAKNDSLSAFGPEGWGTVHPDTKYLTFQPQPGITRRETFLERWTAHGVAAAVNADPETRPELAPRIHPEGRIERDHFIFTATGETIPLAAQTQNLLARCDGLAPAYSLGVDFEILGALAAQNVIRWQMEVPALDPYAFATLVEDVARWRDGPVRNRWLERLQPIAALPGKFADATDVLERVALIDEATERLGQIGAEKAATRFLYSATNPIGEECFRECGCKISERLLDEVTQEAAPWIDLWRDNYAFAASRVATGLRGLLEKAPRQENGAVPLPAFLRHCAEAKLSLTGPGMVAFAATAFHEVKAAFAQTFATRADLPECQVTGDDCRLIRRTFPYTSFDEYTYPSADLQLSAASVEAVENGDYQWIMAELHPPVALLHHGFFWSCPDPAALTAALTKTVNGQPSFQFGFFAADFTATTSVRLFSALPELANFVASQRGNPAWKCIPPAEAEVFIDEAKNGDIGLRRRGTHEYLGSFARAWLIPLGFHPFSFSLGRHTPRLCCGKVIVQRRSWTVGVDELEPGDFTGVSRDLVTAVEQLRDARDLPRHVYIRPTEAALRRSGAEGRDKDTKPVYIDFESYLFLEIFHRWLAKAGELEVTEMLPDPDHLLWQEKDGRRTFELRTQIIPR